MMYTMSVLPRSLLAVVIGEAISWAYRRKEGVMKILHYFIYIYMTGLLGEAGA